MWCSKWLIHPILLIVFSFRKGLLKNVSIIIFTFVVLWSVCHLRKGLLASFWIAMNFLCIHLAFKRTPHPQLFLLGPKLELASITEKLSLFMYVFWSLFTLSLLKWRVSRKCFRGCFYRFSTQLQKRKKKRHASKNLSL